jgi:nitrogenase subunit NifH
VNLSKKLNKYNRKGANKVKVKNILTPRKYTLMQYLSAGGRPKGASCAGEIIVRVHPRMSILGEFKAAARFEPQA